MTEVEVLRRWQGSSVNPLEKCGVPDALAKELEAMNPPCVRILRTKVAPTEGIGKDGAIGSDASVNTVDRLCALIEDLLESGRKKN
jgi:hypothetical protein